MALAIRGVRVRRRVSEVLAVASVAVGIAAGPAPAVDRVSAPGDIAWVARHDQGSAFNESASVVVASPAGARIFETGIDYTSNFTYVTVANDAATGSELWSATYDAGYVSSKVSLAVSPDGAVVLPGRAVLQWAWTVRGRHRRVRRFHRPAALGEPI